MSLLPAAVSGQGLGDFFSGHVSVFGVLLYTLAVNKSTYDTCAHLLFTVRRRKSHHDERWEVFKYASFVSSMTYSSTDRLGLAFTSVAQRGCLRL